MYTPFGRPQRAVVNNGIFVSVAPDPQVPPDCILDCDHAIVVSVMGGQFLRARQPKQALRNPPCFCFILQ